MARRNPAATRVRPVKWWLARYDIAYPTCTGFGRKLFVRAADIEAAVVEARDLIRRVEMGGTVKFLEVSSSTDAMKTQHDERQARVTRWMENNRRGIPNRRGDL